jgi:hypothetical protein
MEDAEKRRIPDLTARHQQVIDSVKESGHIADLNKGPKVWKSCHFGNLQAPQHNKVLHQRKHLPTTLEGLRHHHFWGCNPSNMVVFDLDNVL